MRVICLDVDGVLNSHERHENGYCGINPVNVKAFNQVLKAVPDLKIVISSSWRYMIPEAMSLKGFEYMLLVCGVNCQGRVIGLTPRDEEILTRGGQIAYWLKQHKEVTKYIIVDDMDWDFKELRLNYYKTDPATGLQEKDVNEVIKKLLFG